jgi:hypothetical protein
MGNRPSFDSVAALWRELSAKEQLALVNSDNRPALKAFLQSASGVAGKPASIPVELYPITVDYSQSFAKMVAAGHYDWTNSDIVAEHFPIEGEGKVKIMAQLVHLYHAANDRVVIAELDKRGLRPATIEELLAFGAKYPEFQREFLIVALGSYGWVHPRGDRRVPGLHGTGGRRNLDLHWERPQDPLNMWGDSCRFLAVSK